MFPVVGIGASAGGLAAISELLEALPAQPGMAFVVVSHMDPKGRSILDALLAQKTPMPVRQARNGERVEPDHVYVAPPGKMLTLRDGKLHASVAAAGGAKPATIDRFLGSLAVDRHVAARGVILSGTGTDGTEGLRQIHAEGGITFAQEPASAQFDGMPASGIASGCVDFVLPPAQIAQQLLRVGKPPRVVAAPAPAGRPSTVKDGDAFAAILGVLAKAAGVDFSEYKESTLRRRIARRMALRGFDNPADYLGDLRANAGEARSLCAELLIHVSGFFRDPHAFRALDRKVIAPLAGKADPAKPIRVWVPGCARGEELYSIGMLLLERLGAGGRRVQLFGSDLSAADIDLARAGRFPAQIAAEVSPARLKRFFDKVPGGYQVRPELRDLCVFACQDVGSDPPYSNLDLISCRNLLIYFSRPLQERVLGIFHYALRPDGALFLGSSESLAASASPFVALDKKHHIYLRKPANLLPALRPSHADSQAPMPKPATPVVAIGQQLRHHIDRVLLDRYAPPGFYVDENMYILEFVGDVSPYLQPSSGQAHLQLSRMLSATIALDIRTAMRSARSGRTARRESEWIASDGSAHVLTLAVMRVP